MKTIRILATLMVACMIEQVAAKDIQTGSYGENIRWRLTDKGELIITGSGELASYNNWTIDGDEQTIGKQIKFEYDEEGNGTMTNNPFPEDKVKKITLNGQMTNLKQFFDWYFDECEHLAVTGVEGLKSVDGVLYSTDGTTLAHFPQGMKGEYTVPEGVTCIGDEAFMGSKLTKVHLPSTLTKFGEAVFISTALEEVIIPEGVDTLPIGTFQRCNNLKSITLPSTVKSLFWLTSWCPALERIEVNPENRHFCSQNGVLYDKNMEWVINYPEGKRDPLFRMPESVIGLENAAFCNNKHLEEVIFSPAMYWLGDRAFSNCEKLRAATLPEGVYHISRGVFEYCTSLTELTIPSTVKEIGGSICSGSAVTRVNWNAVECDKMVTGRIFADAPITEVNIDKHVKLIPENAFYNAKGLKRLHIPASVTTIGKNAFYGCTNITEIIWEAESCQLTDNQLIPHAASEQLQVRSIGFGEEVVRIPNGLCKDFAELKSVSIPATVFSVGDEAFAGCKALVDIQLGSGVRTIGDRAFSGTAILRMTFPEELIRCGHELLADCNNLTDIVWNAIACAPFDQNNTPFYSYNADTKKFTFSITSQIKSVTFGNKVEFIPDYLCSLLPITRVNLPSSLLGIGAGAFFRCSSIKQVDIPESVSFIHSGAFFACDSLRSVNLPQSMKRICTYTFKNCTALTDINLPANVQTIEKGAFYGCTAIRQIVLPEHLRVLEDESLSFVNSETPIVIPAELDSVGVAALAGISTPAFEVDKRNNRFKAKNGILYDAKETEVLASQSTMTGKLKISSSVLNIRKGAFAFVQAETVELPGKLTNIEQMAFMYAGIKSITIPKEVKKIYAYTFMKCDNLLQAVFKNPNIDIENGAFESVTQFKF